jgi:hypothetical protein
VHRKTIFGWSIVFEDNQVTLKSQPAHTHMYKKVAETSAGLILTAVIRIYGTAL